MHGAGALLSFVLACALHAAAHGLVALVGSALVLSLSGASARAMATPAAGIAAIGVWGGLAGRANSPESQAFFVSVVGLVVLAVKAIAGAYATYVQVRVAGDVGAALRLSLFDALLGLHPLRHPRHGDQGAPPDETAGDAARAVVGLTERVRDVEVGLAQGFLGGIRAIGQLVPIALLLGALAPRLAGVAALVLATFGWLLGRLRRSYRRATARAGAEHERLLETADECVRHADLWVTYGAEAKARRSLRDLGLTIARGGAWLEARAAALSGGNEVLGAGALVVALAASRAGWIGAADGPTMFTFAVTFFLAYRPLRDLSDARLALARAGAAYEPIAATLAAGRARVTPPLSERAWPPGPLDIVGLELARGVCPPITVRVEAGAIAVVVGPTGAGKTTLLRTLLGLEAPAAGHVAFAGEVLGDAPAGPKARPFAWVPQDAPVLADTLAANLDLGASRAVCRGAAANKSVGLEALASLGASHLVASLGETRLGAGRRGVSGGERQWIALARAIATEQPVLLLDEPTSGLDAPAQERVIEALRRLRGRRTVIVVTHRPEPLAIADVVVRLEAAVVSVAAATPPPSRPKKAEHRPGLDDDGLRA